METMPVRRGDNSEAKMSSSASKSTSSNNPEWFREDSVEFGTLKNCLAGKENAHICDEFIGANEANKSAASVTFNSCEGDSEGVFASRHRIAALSGLASALRVSPLRSSDETLDYGFNRITDPINLERGSPVLQGSQRHQHVAETRHHLPLNPGLEHLRNPEIPVSLRNKIHLHASGMQDGLRSPPQPLPPHLILPNSPTSSRPSQSSWKKGMLLGRGTFGNVYLGLNTESGYLCVIKEISVIFDDSHSRESLKQLNQEIKLLGQLSHVNILQYYGSELVDGTLSVYLEHVSGDSIYMLLQEYGSFGEPIIKNYTAQILSGLVYLHGKNTVHRDIKGTNILVNCYGEVKLADFGIAKHISSGAFIRSLRGSPYWMAPEVIMNRNGYNLSVDIWSLGCAVLEMATSKPPWSRFEWMDAKHEIVFGKDMPDIPDHLSSEAKNFVMTCLQRDPSNRPTAAQLMDHPFVREQVTRKYAKLS
ncbi:hypothetical protein IEQ34_022757 [Dendrobium chrysotoxum]|uniref:mitogen-activated protein kinase kinase kinase n=1 Tax=Dendrobium chrysotoxum TaxID=161865 RepID=A0AAV7FZX2_DENCH|nr:hypothetical protein IEQ34_022757 [Dendrobium chrysotoxum]